MGKRDKGRPRAMWTDNIKAWIGKRKSEDLIRMAPRDDDLKACGYTNLMILCGYAHKRAVWEYFQKPIQIWKTIPDQMKYIFRTCK